MAKTSIKCPRISILQPQPYSSWTLFICAYQTNCHALYSHF